MKKPGYEMNLRRGEMSFSFGSLTKQRLNPYEKLFVDMINGDPTFFNDAIEVEEQWKFIEKLNSLSPTLEKYQQGSWGPKKADELIKRDGRKWLEWSLVGSNH